MKTKPVTFDSIDIAVHNRWAEDQAKLDPTFILEPRIVAPHSEITGCSSIFSSKWEELFDIHKRSNSWAHFSPPTTYFHQSNRFFSYCLLPDLYWGSDQDEDIDLEKPLTLPSIFSDEKKKRPSKKEIFSLTALIKKEDLGDSLVAFEKDKNAILSLIDSIEKLNKLLAMVQSRKAQYQKG
jgi:hypothetical protein